MIDLVPGLVDAGNQRPQNVKPSNKAVFGQVRVIALALALPFVMAAGPIAGYFVGGWIGGAIGHTAPGKLAGLLVGIISALHQTIAIIRRLLRETK